MGMFAGKGLNTKSSSRGGKYITPGKYKVRIKASKGRKSAQQGKGDIAIVEYKIVKAYQVKRYDPSMGEKWDDNAWVPVPSPEEIIPAGSEYSVVYALRHGDVALGNIADYIRVGLQELKAQQGEIIEDSGNVEFDDDDEDAVWGEKNAFMDLELHLHAYMIKTQEKGQPFTKCVWSAPTVDEAESAAA